MMVMMMECVYGCVHEVIFYSPLLNFRICMKRSAIGMYAVMMQNGIMSFPSAFVSLVAVVVGSLSFSIRAWR